MSFELFASIFLGALGLGVTITAALVRIIYNQLNCRLDRMEDHIHDCLRTHTHEIRQIKTDMLGIKTLEKWKKENST